MPPLSKYILKEQDKLFFKIFIMYNRAFTVMLPITIYCIPQTIMVNIVEKMDL